MSLYLDASVLVPLFAAEQRSDAIERWLIAQSGPVFVGRLSLVEVGSAISRKRREGQLDEATAARALVGLDDWLEMAADIVEHDSRDLKDAASLVRRPVPKLLPADAIHLATARRLGLSLVTDDVRLQEVATLNGIDWFSPA